MTEGEFLRQWAELRNSTLDMQTALVMILSNLERDLKKAAMTDFETGTYGATMKTIKYWFGDSSSNVKILG